MSLTSGYLRLCNKLIKNPRGCMYPDTTLIWLVLVGYVAWKVVMYGGGVFKSAQMFLFMNLFLFVLLFHFSTLYGFISKCKIGCLADIHKRLRY